MKEHTIWLSPEELQQMLQGSLNWLDIAPRATTSRIGMRRLAELTSPPRTDFEETVQLDPQQLEKNGPKPLEGQPVVWLLGGIGLLTLSSWFYFVLFSK
ncbi:hypothetical protein REC12_16800 [Desulfosporosinus sp. PR]|uniref:hypothetical protein n=1 Tax=Candidatus Desulfosporosinus nitrosoreducens TaxID=3401928 RepID=UPI0027ECB406|nr:hypothetical protein [Desulfosporosinus sp. PR]MDQ7095253.1 hypothetical protein [Desulfosporosinus sp. PR]